MVKPDSKQYILSKLVSTNIQQNVKAEEAKKGQTKESLNKMESKDIPVPADEKSPTPGVIEGAIKSTKKDSSSNNVQQQQALNERSIVESQESIAAIVEEGHTESESESKVHNETSITESQECIDPSHVEKEMKNNTEQDHTDSESKVYDERIVAGKKSTDESLGKTEIESFTMVEEEDVETIYKINEIPKEIDLTPSQTFTVKLDLFNLFKCCQ